MFHLLCRKQLIHCRYFYFSHRKMSFSKIMLDVKDKVAVITLNQPEKKNAIDLIVYDELTNALESLSKNDDVAVTAITGSGDFYSSGADLMGNLGAGGDSIHKIIADSLSALSKFVEALINHKKILVAVVNGPAIGIAVTSLALCDIVYCVDTAFFQTPFTRLGMSAEGCSSYTFPNIMGPSKANDMLLFNRKISSKEALECGLVANVYTKEELQSKVWPEIRKNAASLPIKSLLQSKQLIKKYEIDKLLEANKSEVHVLEERLKSEEFLQTIKNFMTRKSKM